MKLRGKVTVAREEDRRVDLREEGKYELVTKEMGERLGHMEGFLAVPSPGRLKSMNL